MNTVRYSVKPGAFLPVLLLALFLCLSACGGDDDSSSDESDPARAAGLGVTTGHDQPDTDVDTAGGAVIIDHRSTDLEAIPRAWIDKARDTLHIAYGFTSHGSQLTLGMEGLVRFKGAAYAFNSGGAGDALDLRENPFDSPYDIYDLASPDRTSWADMSRAYLEGHPEINVVIWAWCAGADGTPEEISLYLSLMSELEKDYPEVDFVYMTGHLDGTGLTGNVHLRNEQIRGYCRQNGKILYDYADIETYDPDGRFYGDKLADDGCNYDSDGNGTRDANWATLWQASHVEGVDWYSCEAPHTQPLNVNLKAYACWWLWARLAGWGG